MVLVLDGNTEIGVHVCREKIGNSICFYLKFFICFFHLCVMCSGSPSNIKTIAINGAV